MSNIETEQINVNQEEHEIFEVLVKKVGAELSEVETIIQGLEKASIDMRSEEKYTALMSDRDNLKNRFERLDHTYKNLKKQFPPEIDPSMNEEKVQKEIDKLSLELDAIVAKLNQVHEKIGAVRMKMPHMTLEEKIPAEIDIKDLESERTDLTNQMSQKDDKKDKLESYKLRKFK